MDDENKIAAPAVAEQPVVSGPKDPEHGERPHEYAARVDAGTTIRGPAHLEPTTTHAMGGNSEFRSTGVMPGRPRETEAVPLLPAPEADEPKTEE